MVISSAFTFAALDFLILFQTLCNFRLPLSVNTHFRQSRWLSDSVFSVFLYAVMIFYKEARYTKTSDTMITEGPTNVAPTI